MDKPQYSLAITGEWPGAGQTTTAKLLSQKLNLHRVYAGFLFRKFAHIWRQLQSQITWLDYEHAIQNGDLDLDTYPFQESSFNESWLMEFQDNIHRSHDPSLWDKIVDLESLKALQKPQIIVEGKTAVVLDQLILPNKPPAPSHPIIKILLTCPTSTCAKRIIERQIENREIPPTTNIKKAILATQKKLISRQEDNWSRYLSIYQVNKKQLYSSNIHQIATEKIDQDQVVSQAISIIARVTNTTPHLLTS